MTRSLKEELRKLSTDIITARDLDDVPRLYEAARNLYEKLAVLKFVEEKLQGIEVDVSKSAMAEKFQTMASSVLRANSSVPESNPHDEDIMIPGIDTIKDIVSEMPSIDEIDPLLDEFLGGTEYIKNDKDYFAPAVERETPRSRSLNDALGNDQLKIDLNNRLAFVKHLFNDNAQDYSRVISQLNTIDSAEACQSFIEKMVKPEYDHWRGKEEYEARLLEIIERRFG